MEQASHVGQITLNVSGPATLSAVVVEGCQAHQGGRLVAVMVLSSGTAARIETRESGPSPGMSRRSSCFSRQARLSRMAAPSRRSYSATSASSQAKCRQISARTASSG